MTFLHLISTTQTLSMSPFLFIWKTIIHSINRYCKPVLGSRDSGWTKEALQFSAGQRGAELNHPGRFDLDHFPLFLPLRPATDLTKIPFLGKLSIPIKITMCWWSLILFLGYMLPRSTVWGLLIYAGVTRGWKMSQCNWHLLRAYPVPTVVG